MNKLIAAIQGKQPPGIYQFNQDIDFDNLSKLCQENGCKIFYVEGSTVTNKKEFLNSCAKAIKFPSYFGDNWDAFEECLTELNWCPATRYILVYTQPESFAENEPEQWKVARDILQSAVAYWADTDTPMYVFLNPLA